jgi:hypothetical protein
MASPAVRWLEAITEEPTHPDLKSITWKVRQPKPSKARLVTVSLNLEIEGADNLQVTGHLHPTQVGDQNLVLDLGRKMIEACNEALEKRVQQ